MNEQLLFSLDLKVKEVYCLNPSSLVISMPTPAICSYIYFTPIFTLPNLELHLFPEVKQ